jgi:MarR family transcriptional regulator, organic hydroperoxide resistance regulator
VPKRLATDNERDLVRAERDIQRKLGDRSLDFEALAMVSNIYRAANVVRAHMERNVLAAEQLSWAAFATLWVLWVWGDMETRQIAAEIGVSKATMSGVVTTLERRGLVARETHATDGRLVVVSMTADGIALIERVFPAFNAHEAQVTAGLTTSQRKHLAPALRAIQRTVAPGDT